jgi:hypothetical protein
MGALFRVFARKTYFTDLKNLGLDQATIDKSVEVLNAWLKSNAGDVPVQFGITVKQLEGVITEYQTTFTSGVTTILWIGAAVVAVGAVLAWFTFGKQEK